MNKEQVAGDLRGAAETIATKGWIQGTIRHFNGSMCTVGGIRVHLCRVTGNRTAEICDRENACRSALMNALGLESMNEGVVEWNDTPGRTVEDVLNGLEKAALWVEEQA